MRLDRARRLLYEGMSPDAVAEAVGVSSAEYLNRLFVKHYGVGMNKCLLSDREMTLYHQKPWEVENLERDIWETT